MSGPVPHGQGSGSRELTSRLTRPRVLGGRGKEVCGGGGGPAQILPAEGLQAGCPCLGWAGWEHRCNKPGDLTVAWAMLGSPGSSAVTVSSLPAAGSLSPRDVPGETRTGHPAGPRSIPGEGCASAGRDHSPQWGLAGGTPAPGLWQPRGGGTGGRRTPSPQTPLPAGLGQELMGTPRLQRTDPAGASGFRYYFEPGPEPRPLTAGPEAQTPGELQGPQSRTVLGPSCTGQVPRWAGYPAVPTPPASGTRRRPVSRDRCRFRAGALEPRPPPGSSRCWQPGPQLT